MTTVHTQPNVPARQFGAIPRPFDPAELRYSTLFTPVPAADLEQPVGIRKEHRAGIWNQGGTSSCTASICEAIESAAAAQGRPVPDLSHEDIYYRGRARQNFFGKPPGSDTGAIIADICDEALLGIGKESLHPFDGAVWDAPTAAVAADRVNQMWVIRHIPLYPGAGTMARVWEALSKGQPVVMGWILDGSMYDPHAPYPRGLSPRASGQHGYHQSIILRMRRHPDGTVYMGGNQSWGLSFFKEAGSWWPEEARPGEWWAPADDWLERTTSPVNELRALEMAPYSPPEPQPEPEDEMSYSEGYAQCRADVVAFLKDSETFYKEYQPRTEFISAAETVVTWHREQVENFLPPMAAPKYQRPSGAQISAARRAVYDPQTGRPVL